MRKLLSLITVLLASFAIDCYSQTIAVESFTLAQTDMTANLEGTMVRDQNGEVCALIKIETTQKGFNFDVGVLGVSAVVEKPAEVWVYVPFGVKKITIQHSQLGLLRDYRFPCAIDKGRTYIMKLASGSVRTVVEYAVTKQFLVLELDPADAILEINGKIKPSPDGVYQELLPFGKYNYRVTSPDYHELVGVVEVSDPVNSHKLKLELQPAFGFVSVLEDANPELKGAAVYIDQRYAGTVPVRDYKVASGSHSLRIVKEMYQGYEETFIVNDKKKTVLSPSLKADFAQVTLQTGTDADIYINGELKGKGKWTGRLATGSYIFESRQAGYISSRLPYDISSKDQSRIITIPDPTPVYGSLIISSTPADARISIDGKYVGQTPKFIGSQVVGEHIVKVELSGYVSQEKKVTVLQGKEAQVSFTMSDFLVLSAQESANCYIVSKPGSYSFATVKGNSRESVGDVASVSVLWESYGTSVTPKVGSLIKDVRYSDGHIIFKTPETFKEGNAVIAAKDAEGKILWSWHIWLTDQPQEHVYGEDEYVLMDRNLGATSATAGQVGALGLLYQWGRKDPFLSSSSITSGVTPKSTITWPKPVSGTRSIDYSVTNPTTFIKNTSTDSRYKWKWTSDDDKGLWQINKTIYDPCPPGWSVPDGGLEEVLYSYKDKAVYSESKRGVSLKSPADGKTSWFPASGGIHYEWGSKYAGSEGTLWTSTVTSVSSIFAIPVRKYNAFSYKPTGTRWEDGGSRANGYSVRCVKTTSLNIEQAIDLSSDATANSYIISDRGQYKFKAVKGNTGVSVGKVSSVSVLWESSGYEKKAETRELISKVEYSCGYIVFVTSRKFKKGNALIAAKDKEGSVLWSWHVWLTDQPAEHESGIIMDRNLGALATEGEEKYVKGLMYQWGRKDPFYSILFQSKDVWSNRDKGTIDYSIANPTTIISSNNHKNSNNDWYYYFHKQTDNTRWQEKKTMYDPCPAGWKVPGRNEKGVDVSKLNGITWSVTPNEYKYDSRAYFFAEQHGQGLRAYTCGIRCVKDTEYNPYSDMAQLNVSAAQDLSKEGTANCYMVHSPGLYKFKTVKGNTSESLNDVDRCVLLWESKNTAEKTRMCELIEAVSYDDGYICLKTNEQFKSGNALIAALNSKGDILWSWHIWLTDVPVGQIYTRYKRNFGVVMDRNLGAVTAVPEESGDNGDNGLYYNWGHRTPLFKPEYLDQLATVPTPVKVDESKDGWNLTKTINDPCPSGWKVPEYKIWSLSTGLYSEVIKGKYKKGLKGLNFSKVMGRDKVIWYPSGEYLTSLYNKHFCVYGSSKHGRVWDTEADYGHIRCVKE